MDLNDLDYDTLTELLEKRDREEAEERRRKKKFRIDSLPTAMSFIALCIMTAVWVMMEVAAPDRDMMFFRTFFDVHDQHFTVAPIFRERWNFTLVYTAYILQLVSLGTCFAAFLINYSRVKRKAGKYKISVFVAGGITVTALVFFVIRFWNVLFY